MTNEPMIATEYAPYNTFPEFNEGMEAYGKGSHCPYDGVAGQAWDRGYECGMRIQRWSDDNVGWN